MDSDTKCVNIQAAKVPTSISKNEAPASRPPYALLSLPTFRPNCLVALIKAAQKVSVVVIPSSAYIKIATL